VLADVVVDAGLAGEGGRGAGVVGEGVDDGGAGV
jgi:hypothetical protein